MDDIRLLRALGAASALSGAFFVGQSFTTEGQRRERHAAISVALGISSVTMFAFAWLGKQFRLEADMNDQRYVAIMNSVADNRAALNTGFELGKKASVTRIPGGRVD
jgi:hypothetical protein